MKFHATLSHFAIAFVLLSLAITGCSKHEPQPETLPTQEQKAISVQKENAVEETPVDGDWLVERLSAEMPHLNPLTSTDKYSRIVYMWIFEALITYDNTTLEPKPKIAESWDISEDHLTYTFHLRKDVKFTDGVPLTAHDVKFTYDKMMDPATDCAHYRHMYQDVESVEALDDYTIQFKSNGPYFRHLIVFGLLRILPEHIYGKGDINNHPNNREPIGSGPYIFESWETGRQVTLVRNENYWGKKPRILKRVFKIIADDNAAFQVFESGEIDAIDDIPKEAWTTRMTKPSFTAKFNKYAFYQPQYTYIGWNSEKPQFKDKRVRIALTQLLDRELILETIWQGLGKTITGPQFIDSPEYNTEVKAWPFDPKQAKALLDESGWIDSDGDGIRDKDGVSFEFEIIYGSGRPHTEQLLTYYQEELKRASIKIILHPLEWATFLESATKGDFEAYTAGWILPLYPDPFSTWHSSQTMEGGYNRVWFENSEVDKLIEDARIEFDRDKRIKLYHRLHEILHDEQPYTFLFCSNELYALDKRFHGINVYPYGLDSEEWWVPSGLQKYK